MKKKTALLKPSLIGIIISPKKEMKQIKENPVFWKVFIWLTLLGAVLISVGGYVEISDPHYIQEFVEEMAPEERAEFDQGNFILISTIGLFLGALFVFPVMILVSTFFFWAFTFALKGLATYRQILSLQTHVFLITIFSLLIYTLLTLLFAGDFTYITSLAGFIPATGVWQIILSVIDVFGIWSLILTAIGLKEIAQLSSYKVWIIAVLYLFTTMFFLIVSDLIL